MSVAVGAATTVVDSKAAAAAEAGDGPSPTSTTASLTPAMSMTQTQPEDYEAEAEEVEEDDDEDDLELLGTVSTNTAHNCQIVGIRYYTGKAHPGEYVRLAREPSNPYDRNAIRVDNIHHQKVGHIKKEMASRLAPLMDRFGDALTIDASIPRPGNHYCLPIVMDLRGKKQLANGGGGNTNSNNNSVMMMHQHVDAFCAHVLYPSHRNEQQRRLAAAAAAQNRAAAAVAQPTVQVQTKKLDWTTQKKQLDDFFNEQCKHQLENLPDMEMPAQLTQTLFDHQVQGVKWLVQRERGQEPSPFYQQVVEGNKTVWFCNITNAAQDYPPKIVRGGILADDMGLGKTIQAIALILSNPPEGKVYQAPVAAAVAAPSNGDDDEKPAAVDIPQKKPLKTAVKALKVTALKNVLLAAGIAAPAKKPDMAAAVLAGLDAGTISLQSYYTAIAEPAPVAAPVLSNTAAATLIVCPVSVMGNWQAQIEAFVEPGTLKVGLYHGTDRKEVLRDINELDVLITSYNTLGFDFGKDRKPMVGPNGEPVTKVFKGVTIFNTKFHRVILDEAHKIGSGKSRIFKACIALLAERRICLSGTPIQNRPEELQALFEFLGDPTLGDRTVFRRAVAQPMKDGDDQGLSRLRSLMKHLALRRNKRTAKIELAEKSVELRSVEFAPGNPHYDIYQTIYKSAKLAVQATMQGEEAEKLSHSSVFEILMRMRQACCSGKLVPQARLQRAEQVLASVENKESLTAEEGKALLATLKGVLECEDTSPECAICFEVMNEDAATVLRGCGHVFCAPCIGKVAEGSASKCPLCRNGFQEKDMVKWSSAVAAAARSEVAQSVALSQQLDEMTPSPKLEALLLAIAEMKDGEKAVIFSQFTKFLDEIQKFLEEHNYTFTRIDGSRTAMRRIAAIKEFGREDDESPRFMLCSLHSAGVGLNLTRGNHVFMMDTWWNEAVEQQAMDRVHRIGQKRPVRVIRFVTADSVESRMVALQEAKAVRAKGCFENLSAEEKKKARLEDVKRLLEID